VKKSCNAQVDREYKCADREAVCLQRAPAAGWWLAMAALTIPATRSVVFSIRNFVSTETDLGETRRRVPGVDRTTYTIFDRPSESACRAGHHTPHENEFLFNQPCESTGYVASGRAEVRWPR